MENKITKISKDGVEYPIEDAGAARATDLTSKQDALSQAQLDAVNSGIDSTKVGQIATNTTNISTNTGDIATINGKIPAQASASNQLADKGFVNSSIQTQTAHFRGNWENWTNVPTDASDYPADDDGNHEPTTNDYMVVQDASGFPVGSGEPALAGTWRFKYSGTWTTNGKNGWLPEYQVNETPLTSAQLAALNSGITDTAVEKLNGIEAGAEVNDINSISVNGTAVTPDANKNVDLTIDGGFVVRNVSTADYNYPTTGTPTQLDVALLPPGTYTTTERMTLRRPNGTTWASLVGETFTVLAPYQVFHWGTSNYDRALWARGGIHPTFSLRCIDGLTSSSATTPLSANQGRVLKGLIDAKQDALTFDSTPTENSTNPVTSGGVFSALAGAGGIKTLTSADYNYPTAGPQYIALWLLPEGVYKVVDGTKLRYRSDQSDIYASYIFMPDYNSDSRYGLLIGKSSDSSGCGSMVFEKVDNSTVQPVLWLKPSSTWTNNLFVPLSAAQGVTLKNNIGDLTTLTTTDKTSAVAAINEVNTKAVGTAETITIATNDWAALSSSDPYDYSATVNVTATIEANSTVELLNDQAVLFSTYGFAIGAVDTTNNTVTIYSIGQPDASVSLKINVKG